MIAKRRAIDPAYRQKAAHQAADIFEKSSLFKYSQHIACYLPLPDEFDCYPIIEKIWAAKKNCYLPVLTQENSLQFAVYKKNDPLQLNRYKIQEPMQANFFPLDKLDIVVTPLVGFDFKGNRLGMGAGYYDRTFSQKAFLLGLAYLIQSTEELPKDHWDKPLKAVLTEKSLTQF